MLHLRRQFAGTTLSYRLVSMKTLLTFTGFQDPFAKGPLAENEQVGPILSLLSARRFERVVLLSTPNTTQHSRDTKDAIDQRYPEVTVELIEVPLADPTDYAAITKGVREAFRLIPKSPDGDEYFVSVASGTPQMHAVWILLIASGDIPARVLHVRPPRFVSRERPLVSEIDLTSATFPTVRWEFTQPTPDYAPSKELAEEIRVLGIVAEVRSISETNGRSLETKRGGRTCRTRAGMSPLAMRRIQTACICGVPDATETKYSSPSGDLGINRNASRTPLVI